MTEWTSDELTRIAAADELQIAYLRRNGTLGRPRTIWVVRDGDDLYVRSVNGRTSACIDDQVDAAYRAKYRRYAANIVNSVVSPQARAATLRLAPHRASS